MEPNAEKKSNFLKLPDFHKKFIEKNKLTAKPINKFKYDSNLNCLPSEILLKIFSFLKVGELFVCSHVCKDWHKASNDISLWMKQAILYKCNKELEKISNEYEIDFKQAFKRILINKRNLALFKLGEKLNKRINNYTGLPDLKFNQNDISNFEWFLEFFDKNSNSLICLRINEKNIFDAGFSIMWTDLSEINLKLVQEADKIVVFVNVPIYLDYRNGNVTNIKSKYSYYNINTERIEVVKMVNFFKIQSDNKNQIIKTLHEDPLVKIVSANSNFLIGYWNSAKKEPAFLAFNSIFDLKLIENIFKNKSKSSKSQSGKSSKKIEFNKDLELDSKFGLHDYKVYLCMRNQTKTVFLSLKENVFVANIINFRNKNVLHLNVINCDMVHDIGPQISLLPIFTWKTETFSKNNIDLLTLIDLCIFDSNKMEMIANTFPVKLLKGDKNETEKRISDIFISSENYWLEYENENFLLESNIIALKDEFTFANKSTSYHMNKLDLYLSLDFVNSWFGTKFK